MDSPIFVPLLRAGIAGMVHHAQLLLGARDEAQVPMLAQWALYQLNHHPSHLLSPEMFYTQLQIEA